MGRAPGKQSEAPLLSAALSSPRLGLVVAIMGTPTALGGCRQDRCRGAPPAFELEMILPPGVDGSRVTQLFVELVADGRRRTETIPVTGELGEGQTTTAVWQGEL